MKVLMISLDNSILDTQSDAASRMKSYGSICDELHILVLKGTGERIEISENVFAYPCGTGLKFLAIFRAKKISKEILFAGGEWIITCQDPFATGIVGWLLARKFKKGLEIQMHGDFYSNPYWRKEKFINSFLWLTGKFILKRADGIRVVSERIKKSISSFAKGKIYEIPVLANVINDGDANFLKNKFPGAYPIILAVGNLVPVKNHKFLLEVFAEIKNKSPKAKLVIAGDGPLRENLKLQITAPKAHPPRAENLKLDQDIWLAGRQNNLADFYVSADIFVHPSLYEGWARAVVEAAAFGLPIVMTDVGLAGEVIVNNESGLIVPVNNKEALKEAILRLAEDETLRKRLGEGAKRAVSDLPDKEQYLDKIKEVWLNISKKL